MSRPIIVGRTTSSNGGGAPYVLRLSKLAFVNGCTPAGSRSGTQVSPLPTVTCQAVPQPPDRFSSVVPDLDAAASLAGVISPPSLSANSIGTGPPVAGVDRVRSDSVARVNQDPAGDLTE